MHMRKKITQIPNPIAIYHRCNCNLDEQGHSKMFASTKNSAHVLVASPRCYQKLVLVVLCTFSTPYVINN